MEGISTTMIYAMAIAMIVVAGGLLYALLARNENRRPLGAIQWVGTVVAGLAIVSGIWLVVMTAQVDGSVATPSRGAIASPDQIEDMDLLAPAEDFDFKLVATGETQSLSDLKGKVIVLNLWATWCAPCLYEIPDLNRIHRDYADSGVVVLSVSDELPDELRAFGNTRPLETISAFVDPSARLPQTVRAGLEIRPTSYVIDREGMLRKYVLGARSYSYFRRAISPYL
ncbi:MAG: TlpA disulfide reductase family protein [Rhodothermales bacterium]|nr:TlpA disulfide reductase family protein [Rhodothermales bacterium]